MGSEHWSMQSSVFHTDWQWLSWVSGKDSFPIPVLPGDTMSAEERAKVREKEGNGDLHSLICHRPTDP